MLHKIKTTLLAIKDDEFLYSEVKSALWMIIAVLALTSANKHADEIAYQMRQQTAATKNIATQLEQANKVLTKLDRIIDYDGIKIKQR